MQKIYYLIAVCYLPISIQAQITLTANDVIDISDVLEQGIDTSETFTHPMGGNNMEWDFSSLQQHESDVLAIGASQWFDGSNEFPDANIATEDADGLEIFIRKNNDALDFLGIYGDVFETGTDDKLVFNPQDRIVSFPSTMGTTYNNSFSFSFVDYTFDNTDSVLIDITSTQSSEIDGWGEITTPFGTFEALRQVVEQIDTINIEAYLFGSIVFSDQEIDTLYTARYWSNDPSTGFPLVEYEFNMMDGSIENDITWLKSSPITSVDNAPKDQEIKLYPNPAQDDITIQHTSPGQNIILLDVLGNHLSTQKATSNKTTISVDKLNAGIYFIRITNEEEITIDQKKIVKK